MKEQLFFVRECFAGRFENKGSIFLSFLLPNSEFATFLEKMKKEHTKAVHFVSAARFFNENSQIAESFSDDGEPHGTSGMPSLKVLRGEKLIDSALLCVRYFGGTKLGTGGLVRAYTAAALSAIKSAKEQNGLLEYIKKSRECVFVGFSEIERFEYICAKNGWEIISREFTENGVNCVLLKPV